VLALHELHNVANVIAVDVQVPLWASARQTARRIRVEVREIPAFEEVSKALDTGMLLEGAQSGDAELPGVGQFDRGLGTILLSFKLNGFFTRPYSALAVVQSQKGIRPAVLLALATLLEQLGFDKGPARWVQRNRQLVGDRPLIGRFAVIDFKPDRLIYPQ
jgi:hypothetical protein